ncbi:MAG: hypothetical protein FJ109_03905 [Deltaproteobacteria bacterium]|nr:hypothetical protein [Deltaproteobacteria bacterium]
MVRAANRSRAVLVSLLLSVGCGGNRSAVISPSDAAEQVESPDDMVPPDCRPSCDGLACGPDGCRGTCGACPGSEICDDSGQCVPPPCKTSKDCPAGLVCLKETGQCVGCIGDEDCPDEYECGADHECHEKHPCQSDKDCQQFDQVCDKTLGECVECLGPEGCELEQFCEGGFCLPDVCAAGERKCVGMQAEECAADGSGWNVGQVCAEAETCIDGGCVECVCVPAQAYCEGDLLKTCAEDCMSVQSEKDCADDDMHCFDGQCIPTICTPGVILCKDSWTLQACQADGMGFDETACEAPKYCSGGQCLDPVCEAGKPMCIGAVATKCNELGSGPAGGGTDCGASGFPCEDGECVECNPQCQGKECGSDGCGGSCGACGSGLECTDGKCLPPGTECVDGNDTPWDGCTGGKISEFQVNSFVEKDQNGPPAVATFFDGRFVIAWSSSDANSMGVSGRLFGPDGEPLGKELQFNTYVESNQTAPAVGTLPSGGFVAVWESDGQDGVAAGVFGQRFGADGSKLGPEFQVNSLANGSEMAPAVASLANGGFVVTYVSGLDGDGTGIAGQVFDAQGAKQGAEFQVNGFAKGVQQGPDVVGLAGGGFAVAWYGCTALFDCGNGNREISARFFAASGVPAGTDILVNTWTENKQWEVAISRTGDSELVVAWGGSMHQDGSFSGIFGQLLNGDGSMKGTEFQVNDYTPKNQSAPSVASIGNGGFVATWTSEIVGEDYDVQFRLFGDGGVPSGQYQCASVCTTGYQGGSRVASFPNGNFVIAWASKNQDGSGLGIFAQRFKPDGTKIYK